MARNAVSRGYDSRVMIAFAAAHGPTFDWADPALTVSIALLLGMVAQSLARHLRVPGIVLLLATGVVMGPDVLNIIRPQEAIGSQSLQLLVGFAVAIILFEGGLSLRIRELRKEATSIRRLVTYGAIVTLVGGAVVARIFLRWDWTLCILFGSLVIVTGPTVINPLLRRIRVKRKLATILEAEGVFIDAIGAIIAIVALELTLDNTPSLLGGVASAFGRLGFGVLLGLTGGFVLAGLLKREKLIPHGLENVFTLSFALALFQVSNSVMHETGIATVTIAGLTVGNLSVRVDEELREFKEQLVTMFIGLLFVLLAADVRLADVEALGVPGVLTVLALMLIVRPLNILSGTLGEPFTWKERAFLSWLAPRGIVAAAVASLFAISLDSAGIEGGTQLRALVFLVIAVTVLVQGLTGGLVASLLGVRPKERHGWVVLGANELGLAVGGILRALDREVAFIDSNPMSCKEAEQHGFKVAYGSGMAENVLKRVAVQYSAGAIGLTANESVNFSFARRVMREHGVTSAYVGLRRDQSNVTSDMALRAGAHVLFGQERSLDRWLRSAQRGHLASEALEVSENLDRQQTHDLVHGSDDLFLPVALERKKNVFLFDEETALKKGDIVHILVRGDADSPERFAAWLAEAGWTRRPDQEAALSEENPASSIV